MQACSATSSARDFTASVSRYLAPSAATNKLDREHLTGGGVDDRRLLPRVVDEQLRARAMDLAHRQPAALDPAAVEHAELGVSVAAAGGTANRHPSPRP